MTILAITVSICCALIGAIAGYLAGRDGVRK